MSSQAPKTRNRILQAALDLLIANQGKGVRMSDIAKRAGVSRQALYLHFQTRADLLVAATFYLDQQKNIEARLQPSRSANNGIERLDAYVFAWGNYIPEIYSIAKALMAMADSDEEAAKAWGERMQDMYEGCEAAVNALHEDNQLSPDYTQQTATDILWMLLSVRNWEHLVMDCRWTQKKYLATIKTMARRILIKT